MGNDPELPTGCVASIIVILLVAGLFFAFVEVARGVVWIKWMFQ